MNIVVRCLYIFHLVLSKLYNSSINSASRLLFTSQIIGENINRSEHRCIRGKNATCSNVCFSDFVFLRQQFHVL